MISFGIVLPSQIYSEYRRDLAKKAFESLLKTRPPTLTPFLFLLIKSRHEVYPAEGIHKGFFLYDLEEPGRELGTEAALAYGTDQVFKNPGITHVVWMGDDSLFHPDWLIQLEALILRHPKARAWSVYRSAYEAVHATLECRLDKDVEDVRVRSLCGHGMTITKEEWQEWGIKWQDGRNSWGSPSGNTLDLLHVHSRPGERWCTAKSYVEHTGRTGKNCQADIPEWAVAFQGAGGYDTVENLPWKKVFGGP